MKQMIVLRIEIFPEGDLYVGVCPDLSVSSFGETLEEARSALREAVEAFLIYSFGVIHRTPSPERAVEQMHYYCHPETVVKVMVYHRYAWKVLWILLTYGKGQFWRLAELVAQHSEAQTGCPVTYTFTRREIRELMKRCGFQVTDMWVDHIFPYRIPDYVQYRYVKVCISAGCPSSGG